MTEQLNQIKVAILKIIVESDITEWVDAKIWIDFPPFLNRGFFSTQVVKDRDGKNVRLFRPNDQLRNLLFSFIYHHNQEGQYNEIYFAASKDNLDAGEISILFSKEVDDEFQNNMPKSKRGKTTPWWKIPEETKDYK